MRDWQSEQVRYLIHFSDGGSGMRYFDERLQVGAELSDGARRYTVDRVKQPLSPTALGHAWATLVGGGFDWSGTSSRFPAALHRARPTCRLGRPERTRRLSGRHQDRR